MTAIIILPLLLWVVVAALACFGVYRAQKPRQPVAAGWVHDPAVVIIPFGRMPPHLDALWQGLSSQSYRPFRVVFVVESTADSAHAALKNLVGGPPFEIVVARSAERRGQKIHNMLAGLKQLRPDDATIVFADADFVPDANWLARLAWVLEPRRGLDVASGYRWLEPADERWATAFICIINSSIATTPRERAWTHAWGGSMALRRQTVERLDLEALWDRAVDDDLTLSHAVRARGGHFFSPARRAGTHAGFLWLEGRHRLRAPAVPACARTRATLMAPGRRCNGRAAPGLGGCAAACLDGQQDRNHRHHGHLYARSDAGKLPPAGPSAPVGNGAYPARCAPRPLGDPRMACPACRDHLVHRIRPFRHLERPDLLDRYEAARGADREGRVRPSQTLPAHQLELACLRRAPHTSRKCRYRRQTPGWRP
jgi:hypothetical protein